MITVAINPLMGQVYGFLSRRSPLGRIALTAVVTSGAFFDKTYNETLDLLQEARNYIAFQCPMESRNLVPLARLLVSQETMRISCRLTQVMAWLLAQRAVQAGEISEHRALTDEFSLGATQICLDDRWLADERLPAALRRLMQRSLDVYCRVQRLEDMQRQSVKTA